MNADSMIEIVGAGAAAPAAISFGICWLLSRMRPGSAVATRISVALGFVTAFVIGYVLLPEWAPVKPLRHWHWLPWLALMAGVTGVLNVRAPLAVRWIVILATAAASAWLLVPTWSSLDPPRRIWLLALTAGLSVLMLFTEPLPRRIGVPMLLGVLSVTAVAVAVTIAACISLTYARVAGVAACAVSGAWLAACLSRSADDMAVRAVLPAILVVVGGIAFVACVEPERPQYGLLLLPAGPLGLWICQARQVRQFSGRRLQVVQIASVVVPLLAAAIVSYARWL